MTASPTKARTPSYLTPRRGLLPAAAGSLKRTPVDRGRGVRHGLEQPDRDAHAIDRLDLLHRLAGGVEVHGEPRIVADHVGDHLALVLLLDRGDHRRGFRGMADCPF